MLELGFANDLVVIQEVADRGLLLISQKKTFCYLCCDAGEAQNLARVCNSIHGIEKDKALYYCWDVDSLSYDPPCLART